MRAKGSNAFKIVDVMKFFDNSKKPDEGMNRKNR